MSGIELVREGLRQIRHELQHSSFDGCECGDAQKCPLCGMVMLADDGPAILDRWAAMWDRIEEHNEAMAEMNRSEYA